MAVYTYLRVSTNKQADSGIGIDVQRRMIAGYLLMHGMTLDGEYVETSVSGSVPFIERPMGGALYGCAKLGDVVVAAKLDRMFRSASDALAVLEGIKRRGVALHLLDLGGDLMNGMGKFMFTILAAVAEQERDRIRERILGAQAELTAKGAYAGGWAPYGFRLAPAADEVGKVLVAEPEEQEAIVEILRLRKEGLSLRKIKDRLRLKLSLGVIVRICEEAEESAD